MLALFFAGLPALAQPEPAAPVPAVASPDQAVAAPAVRRNLPDSMALPDRALILATDLNRLLKPADARPAGSAGDGGVRNVLQRALALIGTPYRWGGTSPDSGFDCSGLVAYIFRNALGIELPRVSREMAKAGEPVSDLSALVAGDLVFFSRRGKVVDHVGIYVGDGKFVHAPRTGRDVTVSKLDEGYWHDKFLKARRVHDG